MYSKHLVILTLALVIIIFDVTAQTLSLQEAVQTAVSNYGSIKAKGNYVNASRALAGQAKKEALPNFILSAQQDYGTVNGQNGPLYGLGGYGVASSGLPLPSQNWNSAFGAMYLVNINWEMFTFGRVRERVNAARSVVTRDESDLNQEIFQHQVKVAAAYMGLLTAQRLTRSQQYNLARADTLRRVVTVRALNGLIAGVDSSLALAEVSNARSALIAAQDAEQERANQLAFLMGVSRDVFVLDTLFLSKIPGAALDTATAANNHPLLEYYRNRVNVSNRQTSYINTLKYPSVSLFGVLQTRGSGFSSSYASDQSAYTNHYYDGVKPSRSNYLLGVGIVWNITGLARVAKQAEGQRFVSKALQDEYDVAEQQLSAQRSLASVKMKNALASYYEAPIQIKAGNDAYLQKTVLYRNGLVTIIDVTQTLYTLNRAEINRDISYSNVWQALLLKAAAAGNFNLFLDQLK